MNGNDRQREPSTQSSSAGLVGTPDRTGATERVGASPPSRASSSLPSSPPSPPTLSLPKGGGAIRGIGEKFAVNPVTGTGTLTVPIAASPGRSGFGPQFSLSYDSGAGNGPFGFGWSLGLPAITRKTDKGLPRYLDADESDVFILSGAEDLVPRLAESGQPMRDRRTVHDVPYDIFAYRPRVEGLFARIERWVEVSTGLSHWRTITRDNVTTMYGLDDKSRIADPVDPRHVFSYLICRSWDDKGNVILYDYLPEDEQGLQVAQAHEANRSRDARATNRYLKWVRYGGTTPYFPDWSEHGQATPLPNSWYFELALDYGDHDPDAPLPAADRVWGVRPDPFSTYRAGFEVRTYRRCERVLLFHHFKNEVGVGEDCLVRSTDFTYSDEEVPADPRNPIYTFLQSVTHAGYRRLEGGGYLRKALPPLDFEYSQPQVQAAVLTIDEESLANLPEGLDGSRYQWVDLDGEGLAGILTDLGGEWGYKRNIGPLNEVTLADGSRQPRAAFGPLEPISTLPSRNSLATGGLQLLDLSGDGELDVVALAEQPAGFFERTEEGSWGPFQEFSALPLLDWSSPDLKLVDLTGDGLADALITEEGLFTLYPSLGEAGFGEAQMARVPWDEERGPAVVLADGTQTVFLADMSGDGLSDLVRARNGEVCYWPNLGYGRFGPKVTMDGAPRFDDDEHFDPRRLRLADIDGSGTTDLLYVGREGVRVYFNRSGNSWAEPHLLAIFPTADSLSTVQVVDLLGNGTACLVWSSPLPAETRAPLRYVDLMGGQKPHLMIRTRNNMGSETRLHYAPSTRFYLADKLAQRPWVTRLPHVVHVVERVETYDWIGRSRFVNRYNYHHGHYDGYEREFRGFGMVEEWDTEEHRGDSAFPQGEALNWDARSWTPPIHTKTWFHTGAFLEAASVSKQYAHEYWVEPALRPDDRTEDRDAMLIPDTVLPEDLTPDEARQAYRALKGMALRIEVYADDGSPHAETPYTVTEQNFTLRLVQPQGVNRHAVFFAHARETIYFHYERQGGDPRVTHDFTLECDDFGNVLRSVSVGYPRRGGLSDPEPHISPDFQQMLAHDQARIHVTGTQSIFTNDLAYRPGLPDIHRAPLPAQVITAELTGLTPAGNRPGITNLFTFEELDAHWHDIWNDAHDVPYEELAAPDVDDGGPLPAGAAGRRVVEQTQTIYRSDDLTHLLAPEELQSGALPGESYRLTLTTAIVSRIFADRVDDGMLAEGGYVHRPGTNDWWIPSGRIFYSPGDSDTAAQELAEARTHFYLPRRFVDQFGAVNRAGYDQPYDLLATTTTDPVGNTTSALNDYRVLLPFRITDPNGNRAEVASNALGYVVGSALMGKANENLGDSLAGFDADPDDAVLLAHVDAPIDDPEAILGNASTRTIYDLSAYYRTRDEPQPDPPVVYSLSRETHVSDVGQLPPNETQRYQHIFVFRDGFGREIQHKVQAEPGPVEGGGPDVAVRWAVSGWTIYNNKGQPVRRYEPFFSTTQRFQFAPQIGVSSVFFYDPVGRLVVTLHPDNSWEKTVFDQWRREKWDNNDTALIGDPRTDADVGAYFLRYVADAPNAFTSWYDLRIAGTLGDTPAERAASHDAAQKVEAHAGTPSVTHFDSLGRTCLSIADNGGNERHARRCAFDIEGKPLAVFDALGRRAFEYCLREPQPGGGFRYVSGYDMAGNELYQNNMDGGERRALSNIVGNPIRTWDGLGRAFHIRYDLSQRPTHRYVSTDGAPASVLLERLVYGEGLADRNLSGRLFRQYDAAGLVVNERYDFKGNLAESARHFAREYRQSIDWSDLADLTTADELDAATAPVLSASDRFLSESRYDALNRPVQIVTPHTATMRPSVLRPSYNEAALLVQIDVWARQADAPAPAPAMLLDTATADYHAITDVDYDARGQRTRLSLGNGTVTTYEYDKESLRLVRLTTTRPDNIPADRRVVQDLYYTYDPIGNITRIRDEADTQNVIYFRNQRVDPTGDYTYDAMYRLTRATGREHLGQNAGNLNPPSQVTNDDGFRTGILHPNDGNAMGTYVESYEYDLVGNLTAMVHDVISGAWTRRYAYAEPSRIAPGETGNRLSATSLPGDPAAGPYSARYAHDARGNMVAMPHLPRLAWDERDHLRSTTRQVVNNGGTPETTFSVYDSEGRRQRKVTDRQAPANVAPTRRTERLYLGALELYREYAGDGVTVTLERETLHVLTGQHRVAMIETRTLGNDAAPAQMVRYHYTNHLDSAILELDEQAEIVSYEEYFPFGSSAYQAVRSQTETPRRYRYAGKERDEESDLYYYGARYYVPWLGLWTSVDPALVLLGGRLAREALQEAARQRERSQQSGRQASNERSPGAAPPDPEGPGRTELDRNAHLQGPWQGGQTGLSLNLNAYVYALDNPVVYSDPDGGEPTVVGRVYVIEGTVGGEAVSYTGSTVQELRARFSTHKWRELINAESTKITAYEVRAELNVAASGRGTLRSAANEALRSAEQQILSKVSQTEGVTVLNSIRAAEAENAVVWAERHSVQVGKPTTFKGGAGGVVLGANAALLLLDVYRMYLEEKRSQYVFAPYLLEDEKGVFTLQEQDRGIFRSNYYFKNYQTGPNKGQSVRIEKDEFNRLRKEAEALWGTLDWKGDFVPGILRRSLPVITVMPSGPYA